MKKQIFYFGAIIIIATVLFLSSCAKSSSGTNNSNNSSDITNASVVGKWNYQADIFVDDSINYKPYDTTDFAAGSYLQLNSDLSFNLYVKANEPNEPWVTETGSYSRNANKIRFIGGQQYLNDKEMAIKSLNSSQMVLFYFNPDPQTQDEPRLLYFSK